MPLPFWSRKAAAPVATVTPTTVNSGGFSVWIGPRSTTSVSGLRRSSRVAMTSAGERGRGVFRGMNLDVIAGHQVRQREVLHIARCSCPPAA